jgi:hypothetical protein
VILLIIAFSLLLLTSPSFWPPLPSSIFLIVLPLTVIGLLLVLSQCNKLCPDTPS